MDTYNGWSQEDTNDISEEHSKMHDEKHAEIHSADHTSYRNGMEKEISEQIAERTQTEEIQVKKDEAVERARKAHLRKLDNRQYDPNEDIMARIIRSS